MYFGEVVIQNERVIKQGQGIIFFENQNVYVGDFKNNLREGKGQLLKIIEHGLSPNKTKEASTLI